MNEFITCPKCKNEFLIEEQTKTQCKCGYWLMTIHGRYNQNEGNFNLLGGYTINNMKILKIGVIL